MLRQTVLNTQGAASSFETNPKRVRLGHHYGPTDALTEGQFNKVLSCINVPLTLWQHVG